VQKLKFIFTLLFLAQGGISFPQDLTYDGLLKLLAEDFKTPGVAVGIMEEGVFREYFYGEANLDSEAPVDHNTIFNVASLSKMVTAIAVMQLVDSGKVELDQPINSYLNTYKVKSNEYNVDQVTIRRILNHTAGLSGEFGPGFSRADTLLPLVSILDGQSEKRQSLRVVYEPGSKSSYSNLGFGLLQLLIEEITGLSFQDYIESHIFGPLGMKHSSFEDPMHLDSTHMATPYTYLLEPMEPERFVVVAAAGLYTSLKDLEIMMVEESSIHQILSGDLYEEMFVSDGSYGLGHIIHYDQEDIAFAGHTGVGTGWRASYQIIPGTKNGIIVLTNGDNGSYIHETLTCYWYSSVTGKYHSICSSPVLKKLNRIDIYLEIAGEFGLLNKTNLESFQSSVRQLRDHAAAGEYDLFRTALAELQSNLFKALEGKSLDIELLPPQMMPLFEDGSLEVVLKNTFRSVIEWASMPWCY